MSTDLEKAVHDATMAALEEWRTIYPEFVEREARLHQLSAGITGLAEAHQIEIPEKERLEMAGFFERYLTRRRRQYVQQHKKKKAEKGRG